MHIQLVKEQTPEGYVTEEKLLQFNIETERYDSVLEIKLDRDRAEACQWMITLQSEDKVKDLEWWMQIFKFDHSNLHRFMLKMLISSIIETFHVSLMHVRQLHLTTTTPMSTHQDLLWRCLRNMPSVHQS